MNDERQPLWSDDRIINEITNHPKGFAAAVSMRNEYEARIAELEKGFNNDIPKIQSLAYSEGYAAGQDDALRRH